jgi:multidrug efflux pump subunit AcrB
VRDTVSEAGLGLIRLQWWRDTIAGIYAGNATPAYSVAEVMHGPWELMGTGFPVLVYAPDDAARAALAARVMALLRASPGVVDVDAYREADQARTRIVPDLAQAARHGIAAEDIARAIDPVEEFAERVRLVEMRLVEVVDSEL